MGQQYVEQRQPCKWHFAHEVITAFCGLLHLLRNTLSKPLKCPANNLNVLSHLLLLLMSAE